MLLLLKSLPHEWHCSPLRHWNILTSLILLFRKLARPMDSTSSAYCIPWVHPGYNLSNSFNSGLEVGFFLYPACPHLSSCYRVRLLSLKSNYLYPIFILNIVWSNREISNSGCLCTKGSWLSLWGQYSSLLLHVLLLHLFPQPPTQIHRIIFRETKALCCLMPLYLPAQFCLEFYSVLWCSYSVLKIQLNYYIFLHCPQFHLYDISLLS